MLQTAPTGEVTPVTLYRKKRKKKKTSRELRGAEMVMERLVEAQKTVADVFADQFESSRERTKNGWLLDLGGNVFKAIRKGGKKLRLGRFPR